MTAARDGLTPEEVRQFTLIELAEAAAEVQAQVGDLPGQIAERVAGLERRARWFRGILCVLGAAVLLLSLLAAVLALRATQFDCHSANAHRVAHERFWDQHLPQLLHGQSPAYIARARAQIDAIDRPAAC